MAWQLTQFPTAHERLDSNNKIKKSKCFILCRLGAGKPFFLSLSLTEFVPNSQGTQYCVVSHLASEGRRINWPNGMAGALNEIILTKRTNLISRFDTLDVFSIFS
jgi:hypothetical protein